MSGWYGRLNRTGTPHPAFAPEEEALQADAIILTPHSDSPHAFWGQYTGFMLEAQVHRQLLQLLRLEPPHAPWPHQLTMGRLVARALHLGRSTLMQVSGSGEHRLSYLLPAIAAPENVVLCVPETLQQRLLEVELPFVRRHVGGEKPVSFGDRWPAPDWRGVYITDPLVFLRARLGGGTDRFPPGVLTLFDGAHALEEWATEVLEQRIVPADWDVLATALPERSEGFLDWRIRLTRHLLDQPHNRVALPPAWEAELRQLLEASALPEVWQPFTEGLAHSDQVRWVQFHRASNQFSLVSTPLDLAPPLAERLWSAQPVVLIGEALDPERQASMLRRRLGLGDLTCLRFPADPREQEVALYLPPDPVDLSSPLGRERLGPQLEALIDHSAGPVVILLSEGPLRQRLATALASQYGTRVTVEAVRPHPAAIALVSWEYWEHNHPRMNAPATLVICSLPFPLAHDPVVGARLAAFKAERRDWFREYQLPIMLGRLQRGLSPMRRTQGLVALLDSRVGNRSYGRQLLDSLTPARRLKYLER